MILVDDRQGSVELADVITSPKLVCRLEFADFAWSGNGPDGPVNVGVERKTLMDLLQSMTTGRLSGHQMIGLTRDYDWIYLLVEGIWRPDRKSGMLMRVNSRGQWVAASQGSRRFMARDIYNFFNSLNVMCNIVTVQTSNVWETAKWLDSAYGWWSKAWDKHRSHLQFQKPVTHATLTKPSLVTRMASQLEGVGWDKARKIGSRFPTMDEFMSATEDEFREIAGIGPKLAAQILLELH
jgi:ERCC4-type nuclease